MLVGCMALNAQQANKTASPAAAKVLCGMGAKQGCRVLYIGDSITDGDWCRMDGKQSSERKSKEWDMNHIFGHGYMSLCASHYMSRYPTMRYRFFNRGISGNQLFHLAKRWKTDVLDMKPDVLSILIGTNDVEYYLKDTSQPFDYKFWEKQYRSLLDSTRKVNPNVKFVLCAPFVAKSGTRGSNANYETRHKMITQLAGIVKKIAVDYKAVYLPLDELVNKTIASTPTLPVEYWIWDGVHPTPAMHQLIADYWIKQTTKSYK